MSQESNLHHLSISIVDASCLAYFDASYHLESMSETEQYRLAALTTRAVLEVTGPDRVSFLQGLVSNDVSQAVPRKAIWTALLTPQGKYLADFFIFSDAERLYIDLEASQLEMLAQKLGRFRLRAQVALSARPDLQVYAAWPAYPGLPADAIFSVDPRLDEAGQRILSKESLRANADHADWDMHRLALGLPDGTRDLEPNKTVLLEAGFDELHGISWTKGCFMGQELTARTRYRGLIKRRLVPVTTGDMLPPFGSPISSGGQEVGSMRSGCGRTGLALLRLEALPAEGGREILGEPEPILESAGARLYPRLPTWFGAPNRTEGG